MQESSSIPSNKINWGIKTTTNMYAPRRNDKDSMVRTKINKKEMMGISDGKVLGEGGAILVGMEGAPLPAVIDVSSLSKKIMQETHCQNYAHNLMSRKINI